MCTDIHMSPHQNTEKQRETKRKWARQRREAAHIQTRTNLANAKTHTSITNNIIHTRVRTKAHTNQHKPHIKKNTNGLTQEHTGAIPYIPIQTHTQMTRTNIRTPKQKPINPPDGTQTHFLPFFLSLSYSVCLSLALFLIHSIALCRSLFLAHKKTHTHTQSLARNPPHTQEHDSKNTCARARARNHTRRHACDENQTWCTNTKYTTHQGKENRWKNLLKIRGVNDV